MFGSAKTAFQEIEGLLCLLMSAVLFGSGAIVHAVSWVRDGVLAGLLHDVWTVNAHALNLRTGPSMTHAILQPLPQETRVTLLGEQTQVEDTAWVKVRTREGVPVEGWVNREGLRQ